MADIFYVKNLAGQLVQASFLTDANGNPIEDPNVSVALNAKIYNADGVLLVDSNGQPDGYLIAPLMRYRQEGLRER